MKSIKKGSPHGRTGSVTHGWKIRLGGLALVGALLVAVFAATPVRADSEAPMTQLEFIKWMVQLTGANDQFNANSTANDYVQWARDNGMNPSGGWKTAEALTREQLAVFLVQYLNINPKKMGGDYFRILEREGVVIPADNLVTRSGFVSLVDQFGMQSLALKFSQTPKSMWHPLPPQGGWGKPPPGGWHHAWGNTLVNPGRGNK